MKSCHIHTDRKMFLILNGKPVCKECSTKARVKKNKRKSHFTVIGLKESRKIEGGV